MINFLAFQPHKSQNQQSIVYQENPRTRGSRSQANLLASEADKPTERMNFCSKMTTQNGGHENKSCF